MQHKHLHAPAQLDNGWDCASPSHPGAALELQHPSLPCQGTEGTEGTSASSRKKTAHTSCLASDCQASVDHAADDSTWPRPATSSASASPSDRQSTRVQSPPHQPARSQTQLQQQQTAQTENTAAPASLLAGLVMEGGAAGHLRPPPPSLPLGLSLTQTRASFL